MAHTEALQRFGPEGTYVLPLYNLLAKTNHMAPPTTRDLKIAVLHVPQRTGEGTYPTF